MKTKELAKELLSTFNKLTGRAETYEPMGEGLHTVRIVAFSETVSAKGNEMLKISWQHCTTGSITTTYTLKTRVAEYLKIKKCNFNEVWKVQVKHSGQFTNVTPVIKLDKDIEFVEEPVIGNTIIIYDIEVFKYDWTFSFKEYFSGKRFHVHNDLPTLLKFYNKHKNSIFIGYNSAGYDNHIFKGILQGKNPYELSKEIIEGDSKNMKIFKMYDTKLTPVFGFDLYQDNKGASLKEIGGFEGLNIMESSIPFDLDRPLKNWKPLIEQYDKTETSDDIEDLLNWLESKTDLNREQLEQVYKGWGFIDEIEENFIYNDNDVDITEVRFEKLVGALLAKTRLCEIFKLPKINTLKTNGNLTAEILQPVPHKDRGDYYDKYELPECINIENDELINHFLGDKLPDDMSLTVKYRDLENEYGEGGIHSAIPQFVELDTLMYQKDVGSLYPTTAVLFDYISRNIPNELKGLYNEIRLMRLEAKHNGDSLTSDAYKLVLNTVYGVLRAEFNKLYDARQAINICITGQLALTDLMEKTEPHATIVQTNTDAVTYIPFSDDDKQVIENIADDWQKRTGYELDTDVIVRMIQRDVNNYVAVFDNGKVKKKGWISLGGGFTYTNAIVANSLVELFVNDTCIEDTINNCEDFKEFQLVKKVGYTYDETRGYTDLENDEYKVIQKVNRILPIKESAKDKYDLIKVRKYKKPVQQEDGTFTKTNPEIVFANEPKYYTLVNEDLKECHVSLEDLDRQYYIDLAYEQLIKFVGE